MLDLSFEIDTATLLDTLPSAPSPEVSDKYMFVDTRRVVQDMRDLGFEVAGFRRPKFRTRAGAFALHEVDFRSPKDMAKGIGEAPRVLFLNSYDGSRRAQLVSGIIRFICTNGLIAGDIMEEQKFLHVGDYEEELLTHLKTVGEATGRLFDRIEDYKSITLDKSQYHELAVGAAALRFPDQELKFDPATLLMPRRREDTRKDLWTTWNVLQENLLKGGVPGRTEKGDIRVTRPLNQIQKSNDLNGRLWDLMEGFAERV